MVSRQKLLDAAARVYAEVGFRGATTRRIADEAGVNEVTIFRLFGSKAALLGEAVHVVTPQSPDEELPETPGDPLRELTAWATRQHEFLRAHSSLIRKSLAEVEELPEMGTTACEGCMRFFGQLSRYASQLKARWGATDVNEHVAAAMLVSAIFADAIGRDAMPTVYSLAEPEAPEAYVRVFLHALGMPGENGNGRAVPRPKSPRT